MVESMLLRWALHQEKLYIDFYLFYKVKSFSLFHYIKRTYALFSFPDFTERSLLSILWP